MITRLSHCPIWVLDQDIAYDFYVNKLGFDVRMDHTMPNGFRWLTVGPPTQPDIDLVLMPVGDPLIPERETAALVAEVVRRGAAACGVFEVDDCLQTFRELSARGVSFRGEPTEQFYGIEVLMEDPFGNWFSLTQRRPFMA